MSINKYKIGQKVKVRTYADLEKEYAFNSVFEALFIPDDGGYAFTEIMDSFAETAGNDRVLEIMKIDTERVDNRDIRVLYILGNGIEVLDNYYFLEEMFDEDFREEELKKKNMFEVKENLLREPVLGDVI